MRRTPLLLLALVLLTACAKAPAPAATPVAAPPVTVPPVAAPTAAPAGTVPTAPSAATPEPTPPPPPVKRQDWAAGTPEHAVQAFYAEYLQQPRLGDRTYRQLKYLSPELIQQVDTLLADWEKNGRDGYDPFLCAQNTPQQVIADKAEISGGKAIVRAYGGPWSGNTWTKLTVGLRQQESQWQLETITCPAR